ncbi:asparagine synthase (glutamine-hydrolyzing) [Microvirga massiliensis]|uniref:asparagine synthase (glutamine-hydrolyzing) n=1 Tax=Microvirga massiliensis TaxID=1033741 RepID=UPI00062B3D24|nr:asparagine synthase (glutamine-hydrolyzing) [Microvirga massiliensis]
MCGIAGFIGFPELTGRERHAVLTEMTDTLAHRGPDDAGVYIDEAEGVTLGHRRLSIVDLTAGGHQPMASRSGRFVIIFNGEIYNFGTLRRDLEAAGIALRTRSDTEVLLEGIAQWGLDAMLERAEGMFAFALWDRHQRRLVLVRDHVGIKPLYWSRLGRGLLFASELKALAAFPGFERRLDAASVGSFLRFGYVPAPATIFANVHKLEPGCTITIAEGSELQIRRYWSPRDLRPALQSRRSDVETIEELDALIAGSIAQEMVADVPVGAFLSGGIDSSLVTALARTRASSLHTFSVGFDDPEIDESRHAARVAAHLGTEHHEIVVSARDAAEVIRFLPSMYDEPLSDMAQIPTFLVSRLARQHVTVALSGDGGDELFGGYERYARALSVQDTLRWIPQSVRVTGKLAIASIPNSVWPALAKATGIAPDRLVAKAHRAARMLARQESSDVYRDVISLWSEPPGGFARGDATHPIWREAERLELPPLALFQLIDLETYLPDTILAKVDRASMATSLETRVPLLNRRLIEHALSLPLLMRRRDGIGKWIMRETLYRHVPRALVDRPKQGFGVPMGRWLRGPLYAWADDLLSPSSLAQIEILDPEPIMRRWNEHKSGAADWSYSLWAVLVLIDWWRAWRPGIGMR